MASKTKQFIESPEEIDLKRILHILTCTTLERSTLINSIINSCDGMKSQRFSSAHVSLQEDIDLVQYRENGSPSLHHLILSLKDILRMDVLTRVSEGGVREIPAEFDDIFLAVLQFLKDINIHKEAMLRCRKPGVKKSDIISVMAVHLFSQLIPNNDIEVDDTACTGVCCPCLCGRQVNLSCTGIGSPLGWHGTADILVSQNIPVLVCLEEEIHKQEVNTSDRGGQSPWGSNDHKLLKQGPERDSETNSDEAGPSMRKYRKKIVKKRRKNDNKDGSEEDTDLIYNEKMATARKRGMKKDMRRKYSSGEDTDFRNAGPSHGISVTDEEEILDDKTFDMHSEDINIGNDLKRSFLTEKVLGQIISQTITNGFVQDNKNDSLLSLMIPAFGCTINELYFCLYSAHEDILLRSATVYELFSPIMNKLNKECIVILWILLNFKAFVKPHISSLYQLDTSNFKVLAQNALGDYREGELHVRFPPPVCYPDYYLRYLQFYGHKATKVVPN